MLSTLAVGGGTSGTLLGVCVAGVNVKGEYLLWSPGSQQQCFGTHPSVIGTYMYKYITLYMMILLIN